MSRPRESVGTPAGGYASTRDGNLVPPGTRPARLLVGLASAVEALTGCACEVVEYRNPAASAPDATYRVAVFCCIGRRDFADGFYNPALGESRRREDAWAACLDDYLLSAANKAALAEMGIPAALAASSPEELELRLAAVEGGAR